YYPNMNIIRNDALDVASNKFILSELESMKEEVKQVQRGPNLFNLNKMAALEARIQWLKGIIPIKMGSLELSRENLSILIEEKTTKFLGVEVPLEDDMINIVTQKDEDGLGCNEEGESEDEDSEDAIGNDDEDSDEGESKDENVLEEMIEVDVVKIAEAEASSSTSDKVECDSENRGKHIGDKRR
ncbi:hypothetical protein U1Q18_018033, partial [Sarracenia purpurea var. burkii]